MAKQKQVLITVEGFVQGVGFRFFVFQLGKSRGLKGWVRNRINGSVEIVAQGDADDLEFLLEELDRGPQMAQVSKVNAEWSDELEDLPSFTVLTTK